MWQQLRLSGLERKGLEREEPELKNARAISKDFEKRGVAWRANKMFYPICVGECVLSKDPGTLLGDRPLEFDKDIPYDELTSSEESGVDACKAAQASGSSTTASKPQAKSPEGKTAKHVAPNVTRGLLVSAWNSSNRTATPMSTPRNSITTTVFH